MAALHVDWLDKQLPAPWYVDFDSTGFLARVPTSNCWTVFQRRDHVLIGLSPGNSYFSSEERITRMASWGRLEFQSMHFFTWETPFAWSLQAIGYPENKAKIKAHDNAQRVKNKAYRALAAAGFTDPESHLITWTTLQHIPEYHRIRAEVQELFESDPLFREACQDLVRDYLLHQNLKGDIPFDERIAIGVKYYLEEIPLFVNTPALIGVDSSVYCYHQFSRFHQQLYYRLLPIVPADNQGRAILIDRAASGQ